MRCLVFSTALAGYRAVLLENGLRRPAPVVQATRSWLRQANPAYAFVIERGINKPDGRILLAGAYDAFVVWARAAGITLVQQRINFRRNLEFMGYQIKHTNKGDTVLGLVLRTD